MLRVTRKGGAVVIITNGIPQKRVNDINSFLEDQQFSMEYHKIELSKMSQMINIMRSNLGNKPLTHAMKDPALIKYTLNEMIRLQRIKKEETLLANPKTKMMGMLLKASRLKQEEEEEKK